MAKMFVETIGIQSRPHMDTLTATFLLRQEGYRRYCNTDRADIQNIGTGTRMGLKTWREFEKEGVLLVGIGGGPLDEHASPDFGDRKLQGESATSLVAKDLGIDRHPLYQPVIEEVTAIDLGRAKPGCMLLGLAQLIKHMYRMLPDEPDRVAEFGTDGIRTRIFVQDQLLQAEEQFDSGRNMEICNSSGLRIAAVESDNSNMGFVSRRAGFDILVQLFSSGHVRIFPRQGVCVTKVAEEVRKAELAKRRINITEDQRSLLSYPGQLMFCPWWCYLMPGELLLNGSETADEVAKTSLTGQEVLELVCKHV